jgi:Na+/H+ antiporter NhaD/arsenite permease-like protein
MNLALISVLALALAVLISCFSRLNVGVLSVAMAWIVGVYIGGVPVNTVMTGFPSQLFLTLAGVTLLFAMAQSNGTLSQLTHHAVRVCRGNAGTIPIMFFVLGAAISSMGPGNIATAALLIPIAMATAARAGIPLFLMAIMVGNGANSGGLSPFAPTGIIVNGIMQKNQMPGLEAQVYFYNLAAHALMAFGGYALFGGLKLFASDRRADVVDPDAGKSFTTRQWITLGVIGALLVSVLGFGAHVGLAAFVAAVVLVATGAADDGEAIKLMPWRVILMVCGVTVLIALVERFQGIDLMVSLVARLSTTNTVTGVVALLTGLVSVYSSTSGVVLPTFLPLVPGLAAQLPGADPVGIAMSMNIGGHLVDVSPLSTIGALCIASAGAGDTRKFFNQLLAWGLSMAVVGALLCYVVF